MAAEQYIERSLVRRGVAEPPGRGNKSRMVGGYGCRGENREQLNQWCRILLHKSLTRTPVVQ